MLRRVAAALGTKVGLPGVKVLRGTPLCVKRWAHQWLRRVLKDQARQRLCVSLLACALQGADRWRAFQAAP